MYIFCIPPRFSWKVHDTCLATGFLCAPPAPPEPELPLGKAVQVLLALQGLSCDIPDN